MFNVLIWHPDNPDLNPIECLCDVLEQQIHGGPTSQFTGHKGSAAHISVPDTGCLQRSSQVRCVWQDRTQYQPSDFIVVPDRCI